MEPEDYARRLTDLIPPRRGERINVAEARGRICATDVSAPVSLPAFATSAMDGYALDAEALETARAGARIPVTGDIPAGQDLVDIAPGTAVRVMTGAAVPSSAEVVVPVEFTDAARTGVIPNDIEISGLPESLNAGWNIRDIGEDTVVGDIVVHAGDQLSPAAIGTLAMLGITVVEVIAPLKVGLVVTGDELHTAAEDAPFINNSNLPMVAAAIEDAGGVVHARVSSDDPAAFLAILDDLSPHVDLILTTGGISAGAYEVVRSALEKEHSTFIRIAMRPGGPQGFGRYRGVPMVHFPGTPAGAALAFRLFVRPFFGALGPHGSDSRGTGSFVQVEKPSNEIRWRQAIFRGSVGGNELRGHRKGVSMVPGVWSADGDVITLERARLRDFARAELIVRIPRAPAVVTPGDLIRVLEQ